MPASRQPSCADVDPLEQTAPTAGRVYVAIDIGASSGRVMVGRLDGAPGAERITVETVHRFPNSVVDDGGELSWDFEGLYSEVLRGLGLVAARIATTGEVIAGIGIDTWAVDYGLVRDGELSGAPRAYRDPRGDAGVESVHTRVPFDELYAVTGLQFLPFNTVYQLATEPDVAGARALLIPDLLAYRLTGAMRMEETNASTTGLLDASTGTLSTPLMDRLGLDRDLFAPLISPGEAYGTLLAGVAAGTGLDPRTPVIAVGSHDTASAVAAIPAAGGAPFAYISSGTWSLVGMELASPVRTPESREANFTNERGVDSTIRFLRNTGGLWLLQESMRHWQETGTDTGSLAGLLEAAALLPTGGPRIDVGSDGFLAPGNMPGRIRAAVAAAGAELGAEPPAVVRCILDSLAAGYALAVHTAARLCGDAPQVLHIVGGGSQNTLLCQLTSDATGLPVIAGPVEATALGNLLVQARADTGARATLAEMRAVVARSVETATYTPRHNPER